MRLLQSALLWVLLWVHSATLPAMIALFSSCNSDGVRTEPLPRAVRVAVGPNFSCLRAGVIGWVVSAARIVRLVKSVAEVALSDVIAVLVYFGRDQKPSAVCPARMQPKAGPVHLLDPIMCFVDRENYNCDIKSSVLPHA